MRIAFYGNICNNLYIVCKALKKYSDIDVHLYLAGQVDIQNRPESEDPELENNYPYQCFKYFILRYGAVELSVIVIMSKNI